MYLDTRVQVREHRFRVPDITVSAHADPREQIIRTPPLLCVEVLSPEDTLRKMLVRIKDYFQMGVSNVWIFSPQDRSVAVCHPDGTYHLKASGLLGIPDTAISVSIEEIFQTLDED